MTDVPRVLVLDNAPQTLAVVRSLGRSGYRVVLGCAGTNVDAQYSRYCDERWTHTPFQKDGFVKELLAFLKDNQDIVAVFPTTERAALRMLPLQPQIDPVAIVSVPLHLFEACRDKEAANKLAHDVGLQVPQSRVSRNIKELIAAANQLTFPVIIKPLRNKRSLKGLKARVVHDSDELSAAFSEWPPGHSELLIQRYIAGELEAADFVAHEGKILAYCEAHSVRTDAPDGTGFAVEFVSIPPSADVFTATEAFVAGHSYSGPGLIQFIRDAATNTLFFIENNPRLSAGVADSIACGQDIPTIALRSALGDQGIESFSPTADAYRVGHRTYWFRRDLEGWLRQRAFTPRSFRSFLRTALRSMAHCNSHVEWQVSDPLPALRSLARLIKRALAR